MRLELIHDSIGPGLKELDSVWEYIGYDDNQKTAKLQSLADSLHRCLFEFISTENQHRVDLESRIESLKRKAAQVCQSLRLPPHFPPRGVPSLQLLASLQEHIAQYEVEIVARQEKFSQLSDGIGQLSIRLGLVVAVEMAGMPSAGDRPDEFIPSEQDLEKMKRKLDQLQERHDELFKAFLEFCEDIRRIASDIEYLPENEQEGAVLRPPKSASTTTSSTSWPLTNASLTNLQAWRLRLVKHKAMLVGTCDELRCQLGTLRSRLGLVDGSNEVADEQEQDDSFLRLHRGYRPSDMTALRAELARCQTLRDGPLANVYAGRLRSEARDLMSLCFATEEPDQVAIDSETVEIDELEASIERLRDRYERSRELYDAARLYQQTWEAYMDVEQRMKDPSIFSNRGGILLKTEREKKLLLKELPRVEARVSEQLAACPGGAKFTIQGRTFQGYVLHLWEEFRGEREAAKHSRRFGKVGGAAIGSGSSHDLSLHQPASAQHHLATGLPRKSLAPATVASGKRW